MSRIKLKPQESLPKDILDELKKINAAYTPKKDFSAYKDNVRKLFGLEEPQVTDESQAFLAGFLEGEASLNVSIKKLDTATFGVILDPEFSVTQHVNGVSCLYLAMCVFKAGRLSFKSGSNATMVYKIDNRQLLLEKVLPFYDRFVVIHGSATKRERKQIFAKLLLAFEEDKHKDKRLFIDEMLPLWDSLRMQKGQANESFTDINAVIKYIEKFLHEKQKHS